MDEEVEIRMAEEEERKRGEEEEDRRREEVELRRLEEVRRLEELRRSEAELIRREEMRRIEEETRMREEARRREEARGREEARRLEEELRREEAMRLEEEMRRRREEEMRLGDERKRREEALRLEEEIRKREEMRRLEEEVRKREDARRLEEEARRREDARRLEEEARRREETRRMEDARRKVEVKKDVVRKESVRSVKAEKKKVVMATSPIVSSMATSSFSSSSGSGSRSLTELHTLRNRLEVAEGVLNQHTHICLGEDKVRDCGLRISQLETVHRDIDSIRGEYQRLRDHILVELEGMVDSDKAQFLRSEIGGINQRLDSLEGSSSAYLQRLRALRDLLESVLRGEDIVKVHEARLTEKDTTSLSPGEVTEYILTLKNMKVELQQKTDVFSSMEAEMNKANHWNSQVGDCSLRCDMTLTKYSEEVVLLTDRWRRIQIQIDSRLKDLEFYRPQLQQYKESSASLNHWISSTRERQKTLQSTKIEDLQALSQHIGQQKALNTEIKGKRGTLGSVLTDSEVCVSSIKDYESDLASYTSGLETLLNIPIKRTMLKSPSMELNQEAVEMQTRYMELFTLSGDYSQYLGAMQNNMEELKIRNAKIDLLEEQLRVLRGDIQGHTTKNRELEDALSRYQLDLTNSQKQLLSVEEVERNTTMQCNATRENLDSTQSQLSSLRAELARLKHDNEEESRKRRLAEERYTQQQEEYEIQLRKRKTELQDANWAKMEAEKNMADKEREVEQLLRRLAEESARVRELQLEMSKVRGICIAEINSFKLSYESQIQAGHTDIQRLSAQREDDATEQKMQCDRVEAEKEDLEEELRRQWLSISEAEEGRRRAERDALSQLSVITEMGCQRRDLEDQVEALIRQREVDDAQRREELFELTKSLEEKSDQVAYITHSLSEETRRRTTIEEGQSVMEETLAQLHMKLASSSVSIAGLKECEEELGMMRFEIERQVSERGRVEQNVSRLQGRIKDLQSIRDALENQVEVLRKSNQEEVNRRKKLQLQSSSRSSLDYKNLVVEHSSEREKLKLEIEKTQKQAFETTEELDRIKLSVESDRYLKQHLQEENDRLKNELRVLKDKPDSNESQMRQYNSKKEVTITKRTIDSDLMAVREPPTLDPLYLVFDGVRKTVTAKQLHECGVLDKPTFNKLLKGKKSVPDVSVDKKVILKGTGPIAGVVIASPKDTLSFSGPLSKMSLSEAKKENLLPLDCADLLLDAQAATGHMIDPRTNQKLTVEEACDQGLVDENDLQRLLAAEAAAVGYHDPGTGKPLSAFQAMKKGLIDKTTALRLLQAQESVGGILDPMLSVFLPKDTAMERDLINEDMYRALNQRPELYLDPDTELGTSYVSLKRRCKTEPHTGLLLLPVLKKLDPSKLVFDGVRKPVTAKQLHDCGVLDEPMFNDLLKGKISVPDVSVDKKVILKGTGPIAGVIIASDKGTVSLSGPLSKMSLSEAKEKKLLPLDCAELLLDAQAATGHMIDPIMNQKLTVEEACDQGLVDKKDRQRLLDAEAAAVGYHDPGTGKPLSAFQAMKKGLIDKHTALRLLQAQESAGGILDPMLSVFLPKDTAMERDLINEDMQQALNQRPELYLDPETELGVSYASLKRRCKIEPQTGLLLLPVPKKLDPSKLVFDGVRKPVTAKQLHDCGVLDKPMFDQLLKGEISVPDVSVDKKVILKGTGPIAGVIIASEKGTVSLSGPLSKMSLSKAKENNLLPLDCANLLLDAQAATGHIIDPRMNQKWTVEEACDQGLVDEKDRQRLLDAEAAAVGYHDPGTGKPLSVFQAMKKGLIDKNTALRLLQAQESTGGILDPMLSVFLPKDTAMERDLINEDLQHALNQRPELYLDPETELGVSYAALKRRCKTEPHTGLLLLPVPKKLDPSKLVFDGVRKPVTAKQLLDCDVLDKHTLKQLVTGEKTVPEVSTDKIVSLKGNGPIAAVIVGNQGKMSFAEAKKQGLLPPDCANMLLEAQAATGHIIDARTNRNLTVEEACDKGVVAKEDRDRLLAAEAAAIGYYDRSTAKLLSVFEAMKKGIVDKQKTLTLLQAQESAGGILDPVKSVFLPKDTAIKHNLLDEELKNALNQQPKCYIDPETEMSVPYESLRRRCKTESHSGLILLPISEKQDPSKLIFDGVRKPVTAQQLLDCGVVDKPTFKELVKGDKTVPQVSLIKRDSLKGTGCISGVIAGNLGKMSFDDAKKQGLLPPESANLLLEAQAATGHIIDPRTNQSLTVEEACDKGVVAREDRDRLLAAEAAAIGYYDRSTSKPLSVFEAMKKGLVDKKTALTLLQAQESAGGILDPVRSVFLPKERAMEQSLLDEDLMLALNQHPEYYIDPDTEKGVTYESLKRRCKTESHTGLILLPISGNQDPNKLVFDGVRKPVTAQQLLDCEVIDKPTFNQLLTKEKTIPEISTDKKVSLKGTGAIAAVIAGDQGKMSFAEAKKQGLIPTESANKLLEAQAATGHIIDPETNRKLTVKEACDKGVVAKEDKERLLAAESAAIGYTDRTTGKPLSVFEAMKKGVVDKKTALTLLQAQESAGGILDPVKSVFLPKDTAIKHKLIDEEMKHSLNQQPKCYIDPATEEDVTYESLKRRCKTEYDTGLLLLPISEKQDPNKLIFDGVRKQVTAQQLLDCEVIDKPTFNQLLSREKTIPEVSTVKKVSLKGTGAIAAVIAGDQGKMSFTEAKKRGLISTDSANKLLEAQAAIGHIIDPETSRKLTVDEACDKGVVAKEDKEWLIAAESAAIGYTDRGTGKPLSVFEAMKKGVVDKKTALTLLQAQESAGGILDPVNSVFLPKDKAIQRQLIDEELKRTLNQNPECYIDPDTGKDVTYESLKRRCKTEYDTGLLLLPISEKQDPNKLIFDGVRKQVTAQQLLDCEVIDKPTFNQLLTKEKTIPEVSTDKKVSLKGTGAIAAVIVGDQGKMSFTEAKKQGLIPTDSANKLLEAQAAIGHIIDPETNRKLTVKEACDKGVVAKEDKERLIAAEYAAIGYTDRTTGKPLSVFEAMKKGVVDKKTALTLLQAQESAGGILDPVKSVFLPKDTAIKHKLIDEEMKCSLNQQPKCYIDPATEEDVTYESLKKRCKTEYDTGLLLLPISEKQDPNKLIFDGVRKQVTAQQLLDCEVIDKSTFNQLLTREKTIPEVSKVKKVSLKGTGAIAAVIAGDKGKMSFAEAKKQGLIPTESANKLLEAQAATGHIIDPETNRKLTVDEACDKGVVAKEDKERLLTAESAAIGYTDRTTGKPLSVFEATKKGIVDKKTALTLLQAQESAGGILDPINSVFLPKDTAIKCKLIDEELKRTLNQNPECYIDPETEKDVTYESLKRRCKTEYDTGLLLLPISEKQDPNKLIFDGVRKPVTAQQLLDCEVIDKPTFNKLLTKEKTIPEISTDKKVSLKGTGAIAAVIVGDKGKMSFTEAKKQGLIPTDSANKLLEAQAAIGHIIDPETNRKLTVEEACDKGVVAKEDKERLLAAESAAIGYTDRTTGKPLSVFEAMKKGIVDKKTALTLLQAQESAGGILDPVKSVFLPKDMAIKHKLIDEEMKRSLNQQPKYYIDPATEEDVTYESLKKRCKTEYDTGLLLLPISEKQDPNKLIFDGVRKPVTAQQLLDCEVIDKPTFNQLLTKEKTIPEVSTDKKVSLKGTGAIAAVIAGDKGKMSFAEAKKQGIIPKDSANKLLEAQAAIGHIIDPETNRKLTVKEACDKGVVAKEDKERLLAAESAAIGYTDRTTGKPLSVFEAMKKGIVDKKTALTLLQAQESAGGILDPVKSVFLPKDTAIKHKLIDEEMKRSLDQQPKCYIDPATEEDVTYESLKKMCKTEYDTGLLLLPISEKQDPNKLIFDGVRKPVTAQQLLDYEVIDKPTFTQLLTREKTIQEVSILKKVSLKGTGAIAAVIAGDKGKMSFAEAKKQGLIPTDSANKLLEAQAAIGHIIDPETNQKLTVKEACDKGVVAKEDKERLLAAESAAIGYTDRTTGKPLSVFEAMKKGVVDKKTALTLLQAQESAGGILDPVKSVFLPKDTAIKHKLIDEEMKRSLDQQPKCYIDPATEEDVTYESLKKMCKTEYDTGLLLLPISEKQDPNKLIFDGVRKPVTAQQLLDCEVIDKSTFTQLLTREKTIQEVSILKKVSLKGTGAIAAVIAGDKGKMSFAEAKKQGLIPTDSANKLLEAQAAIGHIIDPETNQKLTVKEACDKGVVAKEDKERLLAAESAAIGYTDRTTGKPLSVFEAMKMGVVDKKTALTLLQAQESAGGILDPVKSVFLPKDTAIKHKLIDEEMKRSLNQQPECYMDPDTEKDVTYESLKKRCKTEYDTGLLLLPISEKQDLNKLIFDGVRKQVTAQQLLDCEVLDKPTLNQLLTKNKTIPEVSTMKTNSLKGTGAIAAVIAGDQGKMSFAEAKKQGLISKDSANKLLEAQAATGHIIDPETNRKLTVKEACDKGVVAKEDKERLLAAESAAIGYTDRTTGKPLSVFEAMKKGIVDKKTALVLLQAQESAGGILDPVKSVFLPKDTAIKHNIMDEEMKRSLNQQPKCYIDPATEEDVTYESLKRRCKTEYDTGLLLLPISEKQDPNKLIFDGVRKPVTAQQLLDYEVIDKPTFTQLLTREKTIQEVSILKKVSLKGTGAIAAVIAGDKGKMSFAEAKKQGLIPTDSANKLLEAQAAIGHIIDPETNQKLTVKEACDKGVVAKEDKERLLAAESAAIGYTDRTTGKPLSVFEAMKKGVVDKKTALTLLQAQESAGGILDPVKSVFLPKDTAIKHKLIDEEMKRSLNQQPECYMDPDTEKDVTYESLKKRCKTEYDTGLLLLPISEKQDPNKLIFDGVRKQVTAQQLLDCEVLDKPTLNQLLTKKKTIPEVSTMKIGSLKGTGAIAAVIAGDQGKMSFAEAKKQGLISKDSANKLLEAQAATGHIIDPETNRKLTVKEACDKGVVAKEDKERLLAAESAAIGYTDRTTGKPLSVFEAMKKGIVDKKTALTLLQAQESAGGILDPVKSVFLPKDTAIKHNIMDEEIKRSLNQQPKCYIDPATEEDVTYESLKRRCKTDCDTGLLLLPISEKQDPNKLIFDGVRKQVTAQQLLDCEVLDKPTLNQLLTKKKTIPEVSTMKIGSLKGTGAIAAVIAGDQGKMSFAEAKKQGLISKDSANKLLEAQAATGHIIDPETNRKLTVNEACDKGVVAKEDKERLLAAESAAIGYTDRTTGKPLSVFEAMKKGIVDKKTALTLLQAQESAGGILDPVKSVFLPKDTAIKHNIMDEEIKRSLNQQPKCYIDPATEEDITYESLKRRCKTDCDTGLLLLPISEKQDPNKLIFDGVRKQVTAQQLLDCEVLDKPTLNQLLTKKKTIPEVSTMKIGSLKGTGAIAAVIAGDQGKMSFAEAKKQGLISKDSANKLLEAQAATGHIIDPETNRKLTVKEACDKGVVAKEDKERLLAAESAAIGYTDRTTGKPLSVFEAMKKGIVDKKTALTLLQAQESAGGILDPVKSVFLPKDTAIKHNIMDEEIKRSLNQQPKCYIDPATEEDVTYESLKRRCKTDCDTGLLLLPISEKQDPNKLIFDGVRSLKGTGAIAAVIAGDQGKMSFAEAKKQGLISKDSANKLLEAQAATGHIIDPETNRKLTVNEACDKGVVAKEDKERLLAAESAAIGYTDRTTGKPLSVFEAMKKGIVDKKTALTLLQAQESAGGILDPVKSVFLPKDTAIKHNIMDEEIKRSLNQQPKCYIDPATEEDVTYESLKRRCKTDCDTGLLLLPISEKQDPNKLIFDGVRKQVTAQQLLDCEVLDKPTLNQLLTKKKTIPEVSTMKIGSLKGTGAIAAVIAGDQGKMSFAEAKKQGLISKDSANKLLEAQAATGHIIDPETNRKLTVKEACDKGVVAKEDKERLLAAESAAIGYTDRTTGKPLSVFEAMKKGIVDKKTALTLLQAQESAGGILDPVKSVFLPKDTAIKHNIMDEEIKRSLNQQPKCYIDPATEEDVTYESLKRRCKTDYDTGLLLLPISEKQDPNKLIFDGVRKQVTAQQLLDCEVLDKPTLNQLLTKKKTIPEVSTMKISSLKGTGAIAAVIAGDQGKMSFAEAKKREFLPPDIANILLEAQAATGYIIDPKTNQRLTVEEACNKGVVPREDRDMLLAAEFAAIGYTDRSTGKPLSVFEAMKKGIVDKKTALTLLQAQESAGGILDPVNSVFLSKDTAIKRKLLDEQLNHDLKQHPECYKDPDTEKGVTYEFLKKQCKTESHTGMLLLPISQKHKANKIIFDGVRKSVTAQQLLDCDVLDKPTFNKLLTKEKTVPQVSKDKKVSLKGAVAAVIAAVIVEGQGKMSFAEAKKRNFLPPDIANILLDAQAATGYIIDPKTNQRLTVEEACNKGVVPREDRARLLAAELAAIGYTDQSTGKPLSVFEAMKKGIVDKKTALTLLQAQESAGGILDPVNSVFLPKDTAIKRNLLDEELNRALNQQPECYIDPDTEKGVTYECLKRRCKTESDTGLLLLPLSEKQDQTKPTFIQSVTGEETVTVVSSTKTVNLQGTGAKATMIAGNQGKISTSEAKAQDSANIQQKAHGAAGHTSVTVTSAHDKGVVPRERSTAKQQYNLLDEHTTKSVTVHSSPILLSITEQQDSIKRSFDDVSHSHMTATAQRLVDSSVLDKSSFKQQGTGGGTVTVVSSTKTVNLKGTGAIATVIAGNQGKMSFSEAKDQGPLQAATGHVIDIKTNQSVTVKSAHNKGVVAREDRDRSTAKQQFNTDTEKGVTSYMSSKRQSETESHTLHSSQIRGQDSTKLLFDGIRKTVTARQLLDCGVLDKKTFNLLVEGKKSVLDVSVDMKLYLKGTGSIGGIAAGPLGKMSFTEARNEKIISSDCASFLLDAQAATGHIIDPRTDQKLTVEEACAKGVIDPNDRVRLLAIEAATIGYRDPNTAKLLTASQAMRKGLIDKDTALRILQAQESVGGILDPFLGVFLPKDIAMDRNLIDKELYCALNSSPECFLDPDTQQGTSYVSLKKKCKANPITGLLLLPAPEKPLMVQGLRGKVSVTDLVDANLLKQSDVESLRAGNVTIQEIEQCLQLYLRGSTCIAGVLDETSNKVMPIYKAMKEGLLSPDTTLELLEAQAASGFVVDPIQNIHLTVGDAFKRGLVGPEFKDKLLSAERAVTGYKLPGSDKVISIFEAMKRGILERGHGIRLLEAQIASGGIIDPIHSHRIGVNVAYKRGYLNAEMNQILTDEGDDTKCFCDPNTNDKLTYMELKQRCITDDNTGLVLLPILDTKGTSSTQKTLRKRRVIVVDPETNKEMTVREAFDKGLIDYTTYIELSSQEGEWEEITITESDGSSRVMIIDRNTGKQYDICELLKQGLIDQSIYEQYISHSITLTEFADIITEKEKKVSSSMATSSSSSSSLLNEGNSGSASSVQYSSFSTRPLSSTFTTSTTRTVTGSSSTVTRDISTSADSLMNQSNVSITVTPPFEPMVEQEPVGAIFDTETLEKIPILEARNRGIVDSITAQRMLEAQACTGGIIDPSNGQRHDIQEACRLGLIDDEMAPMLKSAQKAYVGFDNVKIRRKLSAAEAMRENWLPYEAGQRFMEYQFVTGGLYDPELGCRRSLEDAVNMSWVDRRTALKLQDTKRHSKNLTCPKTKLKISYKAALDNCLLEETTGVRMLQASSLSSRGISSPYNLSAPGSTTGSRSGSRLGRGLIFRFDNLKIVGLRVPVVSMCDIMFTCVTPCYAVILSK
ncbi:hypothetical protein NHX12_032820 [Muraenolepis orangiensis]|uniref:Desmoplakin-like n=1 Tax=Muraenolepis orangiensis TaxID=630683 RepID=A0A9Q0IFS6_9TELE|nr:hypothetical protein NHX12_032820 [Muraenolepis orangiensis]